MKCLLVLCAVLGAAVADSFPFETIDVEAVVSNPDTLQALTNCFLDKGDCSEAGAFFKKAMQESVTSACAQCAPLQKHIMRRYLEEVARTAPADMAALTSKYDPEGTHVAAFQAAIAGA